MKNMLSKNHRMLTNRAFSLILAIGLFTLITEGSPFSRIVSLGDSISDTGNASELTNKLLPQYGGYPTTRFSNGPVWVEYLAEQLGLPIDDYAVGGAYTDNRNLNDPVTMPLGVELPGLADQLEMFLEDAAVEGASDKDLFTLVVSANDFFGFLIKATENPLPGGVYNTLAAVQVLVDAGARHIVVMLAPDFTVTPAFSGLTDPEKAGLQWLVSTYNASLVAGLSAIEPSCDCNIVIVDLYSFLNEVVANPGDYGLTNVTVPSIPNALLAETSLFWDPVHPTTAGHKLLAKYALDAMLDELVPGKAIGIDQNLPGWVKP